MASADFPRSSWTRTIIKQHPLSSITMTFASQSWLFTLLLALPVLVIFFFRSETKKRQMLSRFAATNLLANLAASYSSSKRYTKVFLTISGVLLVLIAMARPQWGHRWQESKGRGIDILIALDTSKSMLAEDIAPNQILSVPDANVTIARGDRRTQIHDRQLRHCDLDAL